MIYITSDTHGSFEHVESFLKKNQTKQEDILIILGDSGINYHGKELDQIKKQILQSLPITIFCIHGNHEQRPETIDTYNQKVWSNGIVYYEEQYPDILFAKDGEVFAFDGKKALVIGGAYSAYKEEHLKNGDPWWPDEQPSEETKKVVVKKLENLNWKVDIVFSHTAPLKYEPRELFPKEQDQSKLDKSTEIFLDHIEQKLDYKKWYCGHYHAEMKSGKFEILYHNFVRL